MDMKRLLALWGTIVIVLFTGAMIYLLAAYMFFIAIGGALLMISVITPFIIQTWHLRHIPLKQQAMEQERLQMEHERHDHELHLAERRFELEQHLALTRMPTDERGHYPIYLPQAPLPYQPIMFQHRVTEEKSSQAALGQQQHEQQKLLIAPGVRQPTQRFLLEQLEENALQVAPGIRTTDGQPVVLSIPDAVHFKLIGSSGFGKSCLAAAILDQAVRLNPPDLLQIALLDLEHKTSRLFEHAPNVATLQIGRRSVPMVATSADEVALHLGYLKKELDRRAGLSEYDLLQEPLMLIYVEEMLSLQFEVDEALIEQMLKDLSVLAVRARKYNMFLLACAQTDYSTPELKTAQKQFRSRIAFAIDTSAARAAGFMSTDLIKYNFSNSQRGDGMYVLETPGVASLMLAPVYDVKAKVLAMDRRSAHVQPCSGDVQDVFTPEPLRIVNSTRTPSEHLLNTAEQNVHAKRTEVVQLRSLGWKKINIIEKVWDVKRGGSQAWKQAVAEYESIMAELEQQKEEA
jgi:hypothetical protein